MIKKNILMWAVSVLTACMAVNGFAEEAQKGRKIKVIKEKEVQFLDENGKVKKKVSLESKWDKVTETIDVGGSKKTYKLGREIYKKARTSTNGKFAAILTNITDKSYIDESGYEQYIDGGYVSGKIVLMDENGNTLWEKQLPDKRQVGEEPYIADNGEVVVAEGLLLMGGESEDPAEMIFVFDKSGNEILRVPTKKDQKPNEKLFYIRVEKLSPNGKYLAATFTHGRSSAYPLFTRFYNLINKKYWDADKEYVVYKITDDGIFTARENIKGSKVTNVDLKNYIGD